jgi:hypothetical protein
MRTPAEALAGRKVHYLATKRTFDILPHYLAPVLRKLHECRFLLCIAGDSQDVTC